jgi:hypothetical protein
MVILMGSQKDVMALFAERDLHRIFSDYEGWNVAPISVPRPAGYFFRISRRKRVGEEVAFVAVSFDPAPREETTSALDQLTDGRETRTRKYLLTPQATDTSGVPPHIRVLPMTVFAFAEGKLVWLTRKKNAKRFAMEPAVAA